MKSQLTPESKVKVFLPRLAGDYLLDDFLRQYPVDDMQIRYTDRTGGPDWDAIYTTFAIVIGTSITQLAFGFLQKAGADIWDKFKIGILEIGKTKSEKEFLEITRKNLENDPYLNQTLYPNVLITIHSNNKFYELVFETKLAFENDKSEEAIAIIESVVIQFIQNVENFELPIKGSEIGVVFYWNKKQSIWRVALIEDIQSHYRNTYS